jgi:basic membrane protein A
MADVTRTAAEQHPDVRFVIVAVAYESPPPNLLGLVSAADRGAFLAGYLAAGMTASGVVGTYGGMEFPPVVAYMVGYQAGVEHYNQQHGTTVQVLGMDRFLGAFDDVDASRRTSEELVDAGADVLMPVAGAAGRAGAEVALERPGTMFVGVDFDWCLRFEELCPVTLTSAAPPIDTALLSALQAVHDGTFAGGTLDAVGLAPLHAFEDDVPADLLAELDQVRQGLIDGSIGTGWE